MPARLAQQENENRMMEGRAPASPRSRIPCWASEDLRPPIVANSKVIFLRAFKNCAVLILRCEESTCLPESGQSQ